MAFPPAILQDNFNRADGSINGTTTSVGGYAWASPMHADGTMRIGTNRMVANIDAQQWGNACINHDFASDIHVSYTLSVDMPANNRIRLDLRIPYTTFPHAFGAGNGNDYYCVDAYSTNVDIIRTFNATQTFLVTGANTGGAWAAGNALAAEIRESGGQTVITVWKYNGASWNTVTSYNDTAASRPLTGQKVAIEMQGSNGTTPSTAAIDDLGIELISSPDDAPIGFLGRGAGW